MKSLPRLLSLPLLLLVSCQENAFVDRSSVRSDSASQSAKDEQSAAAPSTESIKNVVAGNNAFAFDLYHRMGAEDGNFLVSPASISTALAMTYAGAQGTTAEEMATVMHYTLSQNELHPAFKLILNQMNGTGVNPSKRGYTLTVSNHLIGQASYQWKESFLRTTTSNYGAAFNQIDLGRPEHAREKINESIKYETRGKIAELIPPGRLSKATRLVLTNSIYFKGTWKIQFDKLSTRDDEFFVKANSKVKTPMMHETNKFRYGSDDQLQALELPYARDELSMLVLLPNAKDGLAKLEASLTSSNFEALVNSLSLKKVEVFLPKFEFDTSIELEKLLEAMGMVTAFQNQADFGGMADHVPENRNLYINAVLHKASIEVNEDGTEASAATEVEMTTLALNPEGFENSPIFRADHPFMFLVRDNRNGSILFMGRVTEPRRRSPSSYDPNSVHTIQP